MECCKPESDATLSAGRDCCEVKVASSHAPTPAANVLRPGGSDQSSAAPAPAVPAGPLRLHAAIARSPRPEDKAPPGDVPLYLLHTSFLI